MYGFNLLLHNHNYIMHTCPNFIDFDQTLLKVII